MVIPLTGPTIYILKTLNVESHLELDLNVKLSVKCQTYIHCPLSTSFISYHCFAFICYFLVIEIKVISVDIFQYSIV